MRARLLMRIFLDLKVLSVLEIFKFLVNIKLFRRSPTKSSTL